MHEIVITSEKFKSHTTYIKLISTTLQVFGLCYFYFLNFTTIFLSQYGNYCITLKRYDALW